MKPRWRPVGEIGAGSFHPPLLGSAGGLCSAVQVRIPAAARPV